MKSKKNLLHLALLISLASIISPINADFDVNLSITSPAAANFDDGLAAFINEDYKAAAKQWKPLAEKGDAKSQKNLGILYFNGKGVLKDFKKAVSWLEKSAEQGEAEAQFILGKMYIEGAGVISSYRVAKKWIQLAYDNEYEGSEDLWNNYQLWKY